MITPIEHSDRYFQESARLIRVLNSGTQRRTVSIFRKADAADGRASEENRACFREAGWQTVCRSFVVAATRRYKGDAAMIVLMYMIPVLAWITFIYVQHHSGDRPTSFHWWAVMTAIGMFEYGKGIFGQFHGLPVVSMALATAVAAAGTVLTIHWRRTWAAFDSENAPADAH
jgi:hypothetical protein